MIRVFTLSMDPFAIFLMLTIDSSNFCSTVCVKTLERFSGTLTKDQLTKPAVIEKEFKSFCKDLKSKENRFCYFLGGTADAATGILGEMSKPLSWGMPALKVCEKLKKKDRQVCELAYGKSFSTYVVTIFIRPLGFSQTLQFCFKN